MISVTATFICHATRSLKEHLHTPLLLAFKPTPGHAGGVGVVTGQRIDPLTNVLFLGLAPGDVRPVFAVVI